VSEASQPLAPVTSTTPDVPAPALAPPQEERRLVTALFCDLVGFTPLSEQLDPEEVRDIQAEYFKAMSAQIERYGGTVEKYAGDAVLALFGAPVAHEDDAERAVLCALGMQAAIEPVAAQARSRWNVEPAIRVGVNTGVVVSGVWDAGGRQDVAVTGDTVNTAARLQAAAEPSEVLVGVEAAHLTQRRIVYGERRELVLKGKAGTFLAYAALGLREQLGERWEGQEHVTPLVGRQREMAQLLDAWARAQRAEGQLVMLVGDPGVGKSRLISELIDKVSGSSAMRVIRGRCLSYGQQISLWLIADVLRNLFDVRENEAPDRMHERLTERLGSLLGSQDAETRDVARDVLGTVLGLPPGGSGVALADAQVRRRSMIRSLRLLLGALSERGSTILVLEDLHWIDAASAEVLIEILADVPGLRLLVVAAQRPGWTAPWTEWGWPEPLRLRPLGEEEAAALAQAVLGGTSLSPELEHYVAERAGGNPFFVEEMLRALQEAGDIVEQEGQMQLVPGAVERLPSTLTEVLLARLDRLEAEVRSLAQVASVIGRNFAVRLLASVTGQEEIALELPLASLQRAEIAFPRRGPDLEYVFKHVSMREVAYNTLVQKCRQALHLATARAIASLYPAEEYVEMIAYHYSRTEEHVEAAEWLERAGDRAAEVYANESSIAYYQEARRRAQIAGLEDTTLARVDEKLAAVLVRLGRYDGALEALERAAEAYRRGRNSEATARVTAQIGRVHRFRGTLDEGIARVQPVLETLAWSGPSQGLSALNVALSHLFFAGGRFRESLQAAERASELARAVGDDRILAEAEVGRGTGLAYVGRREEGLKVLEDAIPLAEAVGDPFTLWRALNNAAEMYRLRAEPRPARAYLERALESCERMGDLGQVSFILANLAQLLFPLGEWAAARAYVERAATVAESIGSSWFAAYPPLQLGQLALLEGDWEQARRKLEESLALSQAHHGLEGMVYAQAVLAELDLLQGRAQDALRRLEPLLQEDMQRGTILPPLGWSYLEVGDIAQAEQVVQEAVAEATAQQTRLFLVEALRVQGMVCARQRRWEEAERAFREGLELARSMPYPYAEARLLEEESRLHQQLGESEPARQQLEEALAIFQRLGALKDVERTEHVLARLATV
jgi:adenylate cyclase